MAEQRLWWIKLSERFMTSETVDFLMSQKDGANYVILYQMLCLKCINTDGELSRKIGEIIIEFDENKIQRDCKYFSIDTVRMALMFYQQLGLVYRQENGILKIADFERLIGSEMPNAERMRQLRARRAEQIPSQCDAVCDKNVTQDKDIRERERKECIRKENVTPSHTPFKKPTLEEVREYCEERKNGISAERFIAYYDACGWMIKRGCPVKDWKACVRTWEQRDKELPQRDYDERRYNVEDYSAVVTNIDDIGEI